MTGAIEGLGRMAGETVMLLAADRRAAVRLTGALRRCGFGVLTPADPAEALTFARAVRPSVALVDLRCTGMSVVLERLADDDRCGNPALVLLVPCGVTPVPSLLPGAGVDVVQWGPGDLAGVVRRTVTLADRQRALRASSPLTGLPGNAAIRAELERRVADGRPVALLYVDLDAFKPYNDHHGFLRGDDVLRALAGLLVAEAKRHADAFVGHVGGDDFVMVVPPEGAEAAARRVVDAFDTVVGHFYTPAESARGWIAGHDRLGRRCRWPLLSVSVGIARSDRRAVGSALELVDLATEMKRVAKRVRGSAVAVDQRGTGEPGISWRARALATAAAAPLRRASAIAVTLAIAAVLFVPAGSALALAKPGEFLWPATRLLEDARLALADSESAVSLRLELAADRLADAVAALSVGQDERAAAALTEYRRRSDEAVVLLERLDSPARETTLAQVAAAYDRQANVLFDLVETRCDVPGGAPVQTCVALRAALATVAPVAPEPAPGVTGTRSDAGATEPGATGAASPRPSPTGQDAPVPPRSGRDQEPGEGTAGGTPASPGSAQEQPGIGAVPGGSGSPAGSAGTAGPAGATGEAQAPGTAGTGAQTGTDAGEPGQPPAPGPGDLPAQPPGGESGGASEGAASEPPAAPATGSSSGSSGQDPPAETSDAPGRPRGGADRPGNASDAPGRPRGGADRPGNATDGWNELPGSRPATAGPRGPADAAATPASPATPGRPGTPAEPATPATPSERVPSDSPGPGG